MARKQSPALTDVEAEVMGVLWRLQQGSVGEVTTAINRTRTVTYSTGSGLVTTRVMCSGIGSSDAVAHRSHKIADLLRFADVAAKQDEAPWALVAIEADFIRGERFPGAAEDHGF